MTKVRVPVHGKVAGFVNIDPGATVGATIGSNLFNADGSLFSLSVVEEKIAAAEVERGEERILWTLVGNLPPNISQAASLAGVGFLRRAADGAWSASAIVNLDLASATTAGLAEGANLYFTDERAQDAAGAAVAAGTGDGATLAYNDAGNAINVTNTDKGSVAMTAHLAALDPHPTYLTAAEGNAAYEVIGAVAAHAAAVDPHPTYLTAAEGNAAYAPLAHVGAGGAAHANVVAAGAAGFMTGADKAKLDGVATGATANATDAALRDRATHTGTQLAATVSDFAGAADARIALAVVNALADVIITTPATGQALKYDGTNWTNQADATGGSITAAAPTFAYAAAETEATITDATITAAHKIMLGWGNVIDTDENGPDMDDVTFRAIPAAGSFRVKVCSPNGVIGGVFKLNYQAAL